MRSRWTSDGRTSAPSATAWFRPLRSALDHLPSACWSARTAPEASTFCTLPKGITSCAWLVAAVHRRLRGGRTLRTAAIWQPRPTSSNSEGCPLAGRGQQAAMRPLYKKRRLFAPSSG